MVSREDIESWTDIHRNIHKIVEMDTSHIKNCIKFLRRKTYPDNKVDIVQKYLKRFKFELRKRNINNILDN